MVVTPFIQTSCICASGISIRILSPGLNAVSSEMLEAGEREALLWHGLSLMWALSYLATEITVIYSYHSNSFGGRAEERPFALSWALAALACFFGCSMYYWDGITQGTFPWGQKIISFHIHRQQTKMIIYFKISFFRKSILGFFEGLVWHAGLTGFGL